MTIKIGEKIKQLRHRDGRTQEDLANTIGVSPQAISRWEASGGYPDMELIPAIANYFNVSIDELFGYSKEREEKLKIILKKAESAINAQEDMTQCVEMLRAAALEFPREPQVLIKLGYALSMHGWKKYGARLYTKDGSDYAHEDTEYNAGNIYWQEEIRVFEEVLKMEIPPDDRDVIIMMLVSVYAQMGQWDKAKALAQKQDSIIMCREILLPKATADEERDRYQGEAIIALLIELKKVITNSINTKVSLFTSAVGIRLFLDLAQLCESIFSDGQCGIMHYHLCELYLNCALLEARFEKNTDNALAYFEKGFNHLQKYRTIRCTGTYQYTAPLVSKVPFPSENFPSISETFWQGWITTMPADLRKRIQAEPQFSECFV